MNKVYLNSIIVIAIAVALVAVFGVTNHFAGYYDPTGEIAKKNNKNNNNDPKPNPNPNPNPDPDPQPTPVDKEIQGYKCKFENCQILDGTSTINNKFLFIVDGVDNIVLFDISSKEEKTTYKDVSVSGNNFIAKNKDDKYAIISVSNDVSEIVPFEYTYIEYVSRKQNYILTKNNSSFVTDNKGNVITLTYNAQIIDYNDKYIITKTTTGEYHIFNFNNRTELTEYVNTKRIFIELVSNYVGVVTEDYIYRLYDFQKGNAPIVAQKLSSEPKKIHAVINNQNQLEIYTDDSLAKSVDLPK